jgi:hypothetical protein
MIYPGKRFAVEASQFAATSLESTSFSVSAESPALQAKGLIVGLSKFTI